MIKRDISESLLRLAKAFPVLAILGPRQSGKTTIAKNLFKNHKYLSLEDLSLREDAKSDPKGFLEIHKNKNGLILDEFQYVPELLSYIQLLVDENRIPGYFVLTGSQNFLMNQAISQSLAGRVALTTLLPLSIDELKKANLLPDTIEELSYKGEYPELFTNKNLISTEWYQNYTKTYIEKDVRSLQNIQNLTKFTRFMKLCAARIGQIINYSSLASDADINVATVKEWISILEASYIIFQVAPYSSQFTKRLIKTPKLFFYDVGLAAYLLNINSIEHIKLSPYRGNLIESLIVSEIIKTYYNSVKEPRIYFLRDKMGREIDCLIEKPIELVPIEIKSKFTPHKSFFDQIEFWKKESEGLSQKISNGFVVYPGFDTEKRTYGTFLSWRDISDLKKIILYP